MRLFLLLFLCGIAEIAAKKLLLTMNRLSPNYPLLLLLCLAVFTGCSRTPAGAIERVLNRCVQISKQASTYREPAAAAGYVADNFQTIDVSGCPQDFRVAFQQHVMAWRSAQTAFANNTLDVKFLEGFLSGATRDFSQFGSSQRGANSAQQEIADTYGRLTSIAAYHGARIPRSVVE